MIVKINQEPEKEYPWIGIYKHHSGDIIIAFTSKNTGVCLNCSYTGNFGTYCDNWDEGLYKTFRGEILLSN